MPEQLSHLPRLPIYIVSAARTPIGAFLGTLSAVRAPALGATAIQGALKRAKLAPDAVEEVFMATCCRRASGRRRRGRRRWLRAFRTRPRRRP